MRRAVIHAIGTPFVATTPVARMIRATARQQWRLLVVNMATTLLLAVTELGSFAVIFRAAGLLAGAPPSGPWGLAALPQGRFTGETPWTKDNVTFTGPLGSAVLDLVGASGTTMKVVALNDYASDVPVADFRQHAVILATHRDGTPLAVRWPWKRSA